MNLGQCHNFSDFRTLAKKRLPGPIFHYIDGAADDEVTYKRNSQSFNDVDLVPNVLAGVEKVDMSTKIMGQELSVPFYCAPTALQRLFHHEGRTSSSSSCLKLRHDVWGLISCDSYG
jgi:isopentenyl diphosphate isomerase/L-lactate dehydrogenase-like FMN-dependent dehydrogenase